MLLLTHPTAPEQELWALLLPPRVAPRTVPKTQPHQSKMQSILLVNYVQEILDIHSNIRQVTATNSKNKNKTDSPL